MGKDHAGSRHGQDQGHLICPLPSWHLDHARAHVDHWFPAAPPPTWRMGSEVDGWELRPLTCLPLLETGSRQWPEGEEGACMSCSLAYHSQGGGRPPLVKHLGYLEMDDRFFLRPRSGPASQDWG